MHDCRYTRKREKKLPQFQYNTCPSQTAFVLLHFNWGEVDCYAVAKIWLQRVPSVTRKQTVKMRQGCALQSTEWATAWLHGLSCALTCRAVLALKPSFLFLFKSFGQPFYKPKIHIFNCPTNVPIKDPLPLFKRPQSFLGLAHFKTIHCFRKKSPGI